MLLLFEYDTQMIKQAQRRNATDTAFLLVFCYNNQFLFHFKTFVNIKFTIENCS